MKQFSKRFVCAEEGQGMAEYGLILALIALVVIGTIAFLGEQVNGLLFGSVITEFERIMAFIGGP